MFMNMLSDKGTCMKRLFLCLLIQIVLFVGVANAQTFFSWRQRTHATDCTSLTDGYAADLCYEIDDQTTYVCRPALVGSACDTTGEWVQVLDNTKLSSSDIDTFAEIDAIVADETLVNTNDAQTLTNKTINTASNNITVVESDISDLGSYITASSTDTLTNKTIDGDDNTVQDFPYTAIKSTSRSGSDATIVTGTAGSTDDCAKWDANGDLISAGAACGSGSGTDSDAIHDNVSGEISAITEKVSPVSTDMIIIEDSEASNAKKMVQIGNLPGGSGGGGCFEADVNGDLMPVSATCTDAAWEEDGNGDLMPQA